MRKKIIFLIAGSIFLFSQLTPAWALSINTSTYSGSVTSGMFNGSVFSGGRSGGGKSGIGSSGGSFSGFSNVRNEGGTLKIGRDYSSEPVSSLTIDTSYNAAVSDFSSLSFSPSNAVTDINSASWVHSNLPEQPTITMDNPNYQPVIYKSHEDIYQGTGEHYQFSDVDISYDGTGTDVNLEVSGFFGEAGADITGVAKNYAKQIQIGGEDSRNYSEQTAIFDAHIIDYSKKEIQGSVDGVVLGDVAFGDDRNKGFMSNTVKQYTDIIGGKNYAWQDSTGSIVVNRDQNSVSEINIAIDDGYMVNMADYYDTPGGISIGKANYLTGESTIIQEIKGKGAIFIDNDSSLTNEAGTKSDLSIDVTEENTNKIMEYNAENLKAVAFSDTYIVSGDANIINLDQNIYQSIMLGAGEDAGIKMTSSKVSNIAYENADLKIYSTQKDLTVKRSTTIEDGNILGIGKDSVTAIVADLNSNTAIQDVKQKISIGAPDGTTVKIGNTELVNYARLDDRVQVRTHSEGDNVEQIFKGDGFDIHNFGGTMGIATRSNVADTKQEVDQAISVTGPADVRNTNVYHLAEHEITANVGLFTKENVIKQEAIFDNVKMVNGEDGLLYTGSIYNHFDTAQYTKQHTSLTGTVEGENIVKQDSQKVDAAVNTIIEGSEIDQYVAMTDSVVLNDGELIIGSAGNKRDTLEIGNSKVETIVDTSNTMIVNQILGKGESDISLASVVNSDAIPPEALSFEEVNPYLDKTDVSITIKNFNDAGGIDTSKVTTVKLVDGEGTRYGTAYVIGDLNMGGDGTLNNVDISVNVEGYVNLGDLMNGVVSDVLGEQKAVTRVAGNIGLATSGDAYVDTTDVKCDGEFTINGAGIGNTVKIVGHNVEAGNLKAWLGGAGTKAELDMTANIQNDLKARASGIGGSETNIKITDTDGKMNNVEGDSGTTYGKSRVNIYSGTGNFNINNDLELHASGIGRNYADLTFGEFGGDLEAKGTITATVGTIYGSAAIDVMGKGVEDALADTDAIKTTITAPSIDYRAQAIGGNLFGNMAGGNLYGDNLVDGKTVEIGIYTDQFTVNSQIIGDEVNEAQNITNIGSFINYGGSLRIKDAIIKAVIKKRTP